jgi:hypothetical protein
VEKMVRKFVDHKAGTFVVETVVLVFGMIESRTRPLQEERYVEDNSIRTFCIDSTQDQSILAVLQGLGNSPNGSSSSQSMDNMMAIGEMRSRR